MTYEDAALRTGAATGTMKSRFNRARTRLVEIIGIDPENPGRKRLRGE